MMYPFMTLNDDTEITHSEMLEDGRVKVYRLYVGGCLWLLPCGNGLFYAIGTG